MEIGSQQILNQSVSSFRENQGVVSYINEFFVFLGLSPACLIFENYVVIPTTLNIEIFRIKKWVSPRDFVLSFLLLLGLFLVFLH